ncbi:hypothetical protein U9M48_026439 [Paspalum notatum var. saurae]|uniref:Uncharacterized protein n=1 Tax=Paspalum notatum var. saurae TaxID=547442 RepID=A0AAQ3TSQ4_PASNO
MVANPEKEDVGMNLEERMESSGPVGRPHGAGGEANWAWPRSAGATKQILISSPRAASRNGLLLCY